MNPTQLAREQLEERMEEIWIDGRWASYFKDDLLKDFVAGNLIDFLELFDPDFELDLFIEAWAENWWEQKKLRDIAGRSKEIEDYEPY